VKRKDECSGQTQPPALPVKSRQGVNTIANATVTIKATIAWCLDPITIE
jgi:hypothetical protein